MGNEEEMDVEEDADDEEAEDIQYGPHHMYWGQNDNFIGEGGYNISSTDPITCQPGASTIISWVKVGIIYPLRTPSHVLGPVRSFRW